ncbi:MAG: hypothetical protein U5J83_09450 [Bryobacterales bacterium]|nr:hypothetical protein [Bryobacterales bacterium]
MAYAEGTHEYRAWGSAVVGVRTQFRLKDFRLHAGKRPRLGKEFVGLFPSLEEVNIYLKTNKRNKPFVVAPRRDAGRLLAMLGDATPNASSKREPKNTQKGFSIR